MNMKEYTFKKIDAFATQHSAGNPAGVVYLNSFDDISNNEMLTIAQELSGFVSEVGFVEKIEENTFKLRYFSAIREVDFCGHATIAIMYDLIKSNPQLLNTSKLTVITNKNTLSVENKVLDDDAVFITVPKPIFTDVNINIQQLSDLFHIDSHQFDKDKPTAIINAGLSTLILPMKSLNAILSVSPNLVTLNDYCIDIGVDIITLFSSSTYEQSNDYRTRVFAPTFGYLEDPATGSGNAAFGHYLLKNKFWKGEAMTIEQNGSREQANIIKLATTEIDGFNTQVAFGGAAVVRISGQYLLP